MSLALSSSLSSSSLSLLSLLSLLSSSVASNENFFYPKLEKLLRSFFLKKMWEIKLSKVFFQTLQFFSVWTWLEWFFSRSEKLWIHNFLLVLKIWPLMHSCEMKIGQKFKIYSSKLIIWAFRWTCICGPTLFKIQLNMIWARQTTSPNLL